MVNINQTEIALRDLSLKLHNQHLAINRSNAIMEFDLSGKILSANQIYLDLVGYSWEELKDKNHSIFVDPDDLESLENQEFWNKLRNGEFISGVFKRRTKTGERVWIQGNYNPILDENGKTNKIFKIAIDVTENKKIMRRLIESEETLKQLLESMPLGVFVSDTSGQPTYINQAGIALLGRGVEPQAKKEDLNKIYQIYISDTNELYPHDQLPIVQAVKGKKSMVKDIEIHQEDRIIPLQVWGNPLFDQEGKVSHGVAIIADISERLTSEHTLQKAFAEAEKANQSKSQFLANMSHEIRTPLNAILGCTQLLQRTIFLPPQQARYLEIILNSGDHLLTLINEILDLSKIEAGKSILQSSICNLSEFVQNLQKLFQNQIDDKPHLNLDFEIAANIPEWIWIDNNKLRQIFINLISNAIKFTKQGTITLRMNAKPGQNAQSVILNCEVEDPGLGISSEDQAKLFQPFQQTQSGLNSGSGTGLGLALSAKIIQLMGGEIGVKSEVGKGTCFHFSLPVTLSDQALANKEQDKTQFKYVQKLAPHQQDWRVLVVDDNATNRLILKDFLSEVGFIVKEASNGQEALQEFVNWNPQIILMDISMPIMNGYQATKSIKATPSGKNCIIISISASIIENSTNNSLESVADANLCKPIKESELLALLSEKCGIQYTFTDQPKHIEEPSFFSPQIDMGLFSSSTLALLQKFLVEGEMDEFMLLINKQNLLKENELDYLQGMIKKFDYQHLMKIFGCD
jgi:PAS domain S-box-containing protein